MPGRSSETSRRPAVSAASFGSTIVATLAGDSSSKKHPFSSLQMNGPKGNWFPHWLAGAPVVGDFLVVQVPHAGDERRTVVLPRPIDRFLLCLESREHMVGVVL